MPDENVDKVFTALEQVFSKEVMFDEALMNLGVFSAQVRKTYPNLYKALSSPQAEQSGSASAALDPSVLNQINELKSLIGKLSSGQGQAAAGPGQPVAQAQPAAVLAPELPLDPANYPEYNTWFQSTAKNATIGSEHVVKWDDRVPVPNMNTPITVRTDTGRKRFSVTYVDGSTRLIKLKHIANVPLNE